MASVTKKLRGRPAKRRAEPEGFTDGAADALSFASDTVSDEEADFGTTPKHSRSAAWLLWEKRSEGIYVCLVCAACKRDETRRTATNGSTSNLLEHFKPKSGRLGQCGEVYKKLLDDSKSHQGS